jgi:hypothetical protein
MDWNVAVLRAVEISSPDVEKLFAGDGVFDEAFWLAS